MIDDIFVEFRALVISDLSDLDLVQKWQRRHFHNEEFLSFWIKSLKGL